MLTINDFESSINSTILTRGYHYFLDDQLGTFTWTSENECEIEVYGSETYLVLLTVENNNIIKYACDCPYDGGPICKHIVAALYRLQETKVSAPKMVKISNKKGKVKSKQNEVDIIFDQLSLDQLKDYLKNKMQSDDTLKSHFLNSFSFLNPLATSVEYYTKQIRKILRSGEDSFGYFNWDGAHKVHDALAPLFEMSEKYVLVENYQLTLNINMALLIETMFTNDYSHEVDMEDLPYTAYNNLKAMAQLQLPEEIRTCLLAFCTDKAQKKSLKSYSWHLQLLSLAAELANGKKECEKILGIIEKMNFDEYDNEKAELIQLQIIQKFKTDNEVQQFKLKKKNNSSIRQLLIEEAIQQKKYDIALEYAKEGAQYDKKVNRPGLVNKWVDWQLKIAQWQKDTSEIIRIAKGRFIGNWQGEQDYYDLLKKTIPKKEWVDFINDLINEIKNMPHNWQAQRLLPKIYIKEKMHAALFEIVKNDPDFYIISTYEKHLVKDYKAEIIALYEQAIYEYLKYNMGRDKYKRAVSFIKRIKKLDAETVSVNIVSRLKKLYPKRRALLEELNKV